MANRHSLTEKQSELNYKGRIIPYTLRYMRQRKKSIGMKVSKNGRVEVLAPAHCPEAQVKLFVSARAKWIADKLDQFSVATDVKNLNEYSFLGKQYQLILTENANDYAVEFVDDKIKVSLCPVSGVDPQDHLRAYLDFWYKEQAIEIFTERLTLFSEKLPWVKQVPPLKIRKMKTRWGSCSSKGNINLNLHLVKAPMHCIDEVVCHELCHLKQMNHSPAFYALMDKYLPEWKTSSNFLKSFAIKFIHNDQ
jgi:predicted metal-dependent hydrolase